MVRHVRAVLMTICALGALCLPSLAASPTAISVDSLLREMVDMQRLSVAPEAGATSRQQSSYDRASTAEMAPNWFANGDWGQFVREEKHGSRTEYVMAEMVGPGAVVRIWSADPENGGTLRVYLDGAETPALEGSAADLLSGRTSEFPPPFSVRLALGANLYFPIPYQRSCKVTCDRRGLYYHVGYRCFPADTRVEPFSMSVLPAVRKTMERVGAILAKPAEPFTIRKSKLLRTAVTIAPGEEAALYTLTGPSAVTRLEVTVDAAGEDLTSAMRGLLLTVRFDREREPSVWSPLGDFFGSTPGVNPHESLAAGMMKDGTCYANWYMPFAERARFVVRNDSARPVSLASKLWVRPHAWDRRSSMYFHAKWQNQWFPVKPEFVDWPVLIAHGKGRFVGLALGVTNTVEGWWGEGDEKIWVDGDTFPSYFGTGTEDYFGYAWCNVELYSHAYHAQSIVTGPGNFGYSAEARYHIVDDVPFQRSLRFYLEKWDAAERGYSSVAYWYAAAGSSDFFEPVPVEKRHIWSLPELPHTERSLDPRTATVARYSADSTSP